MKEKEFKELIKNLKNPDPTTNTSGLSNINKRLKLRYDDNANFIVENEPSRGFVVKIIIDEIKK